MTRLVVVLLIGLALGYFYGFADAREHSDNVVTRIVNSVGGKHRGSYQTDIDARMRSVERP